MPKLPFGKKEAPESLNDKIARLFTEGKSVDEIAREQDLKPDVVANVIRRKLGEDALPETVKRSKNAVPHNTEVKLKADAAAEERAAKEDPAPAPAAEEAPAQSSEGLTKLEKFMLDKEKKKAENEPEPEPEPVEEEATMEGISLDDDAILAALGTGEAAMQSPVYDEAPADDTAGDMAGLETADIAADEVIEEAPIDAYSEPDIVEETPAPEPEPEPVPEPEPEPVKEPEPAPAPKSEPAKAPEPAPSFDVPHGNGSAFNKMKAFAKMQLAENEKKLKELESKLGSVEDDYKSQLKDAEKAVADAKKQYEKVITDGDALTEKRTALKNEHRTALARAEEEYRRKLAELDEEYNNATARANHELAEKQEKLNADCEKNDAEKESAKQDFLAKQREVNSVKDKIAKEVDAVKDEIAALKEENKGYESFL